MKKYFRMFFPLYFVTAAVMLTLVSLCSRAVTVMTENSAVDREHIIVIDAGHGGEDGGATSCSGVLESRLNLEFALQLNDLMHLLGFETKMIRTTDISIYTEGSTIAAKKVSDLKQRVKIVNETEGAFLVSIHQNLFPDSRYSGGQVFYNGQGEAKELATQLQAALVSAVNPGSRRKAKPAEGVYLMQHIAKPGILVECGFLSNPEEEAKLRTGEYQKKICCVIAATVAQSLSTT